MPLELAPSPFDAYVGAFGWDDSDSLETGDSTVLAEPGREVV
jgi:hypothetical protein